MSDIQNILDAVHSVVQGNALLHTPEIRGNEWQYVKECLDTEWVSTVGSYVDRFESMLRDVTGASHAVAVVNGTAALHAALLLAGVKPGDEVLAPALTFVATANAVAYCGATPHFIDVEETTLGVAPERLDAYLDEIGDTRNGEFVNAHTGAAIRALVCVHTFGHPARLDELKDMCGRRGIRLVEDAAESLGSYYKSRHTGNHGQIATISFNGNKIVTTGGGGAILTNDDALGRAARHLTTTAKQPHQWEFIHDQIGFNYRMPNVNAAIGCAQLERLDDFIDRKRLVAERYAEAFRQVDGVQFVHEPKDTKSNYWLNVILLRESSPKHRDRVLNALNNAGLMSRPAWRPMHELPMYAEAPRMDLPVTEDLHRRLINLPSSPRLADTFC